MRDNNTTASEAEAHLDHQTTIYCQLHRPTRVYMSAAAGIIEQILHCFDATSDEIARLNLRRYSP